MAKFTLGLPAYQHPGAAHIQTTSLRDSWFSELIIYTSLLALAEKPDLWKLFRRSEHSLIFEADDYTSTVPPPVFQELYHMPGPVGKLCIVIWNIVKNVEADRVPSLEEVAVMADENIEGTNMRATSRSFAAVIEEKMAAARLGPTTWIPFKDLLSDSSFKR